MPQERRPEAPRASLTAPAGLPGAVVKVALGLGAWAVPPGRLQGSKTAAGLFLASAPLGSGPCNS